MYSIIGRSNKKKNSFNKQASTFFFFEKTHIIFADDHDPWLGK